MRCAAPAPQALRTTQIACQIPTLPRLCVTFWVVRTIFRDVVEARPRDVESVLRALCLPVSSKIEAVHPCRTGTSLVRFDMLLKLW